MGRLSEPNHRDLQSDNAQLAQKQERALLQLPLPGDVSPRLRKHLRKHEHEWPYTLRSEQRRMSGFSDLLLPELHWRHQLNEGRRREWPDPGPFRQRHRLHSESLQLLRRQPESPCNPQRVRGQRIEGPPRECDLHLFPRGPARSRRWRGHLRSGEWIQLPGGRGTPRGWSLPRILLG